MPATGGKGGGKRPGAGRKAGAAWASGRATPVRKIARRNLIDVLEGGRDPLLGLMDIAENPEIDVDVRVRAYIGVLPYCRPRLSAQLTLDMTEKNDQEKVSQDAILTRIVGLLDRLAPIPPTIDGESTDEATEK